MKKRKSFRFTGEEIVKIFALVCLFTLNIGIQAAVAQDTYTNGILIKVTPGIIEMPDNVESFPVERCRVRATSLRELNKIYKAAEIEKVYNTVKVGNKPAEKVEVENAYIIWFEDDELMDIEGAVGDYAADNVIEAAEVR